MFVVSCGSCMAKYAAGMMRWWHDACLDAHTARLHPVHGATRMACLFVVNASASGTRFLTITLEGSCAHHQASKAF